MKRIWIIGAVLLGAVSLHAQDMERKKEKASVEQQAEMATVRMKHQLDLSEDQQKKVQAINEKYLRKMEEQREQMKAQREQMKEEKKAMEEARKAELKAVLNAEQQAKMEEMHKRDKSKRMMHKKHMKKAPGRQMPREDEIKE